MFAHMSSVPTEISGMFTSLSCSEITEKFGREIPSLISFSEDSDM